LGRYLSLKKVFSSYFLFVLIILIAYGLSKAQEIKAVPKDYGYYILKNGEFAPIPEIVAKASNPLPGPAIEWGVLAFDSKPEFIIEEQAPTILIYDPGVSLDKLRLFRLCQFKKLRAVDFHQDPPEPKSFEKLFGLKSDSLVDFGKLTIVGAYATKRWLIRSHPDLVFIRPREKLSPGMYALSCDERLVSCIVPNDINIPARAFEITGPETESEALNLLNPVDKPRVQVLKCCTSRRLEGIETLGGEKPDFFISDRKIFSFVELKGYRPGEIVEFVLCRPDGTIEARNKQVLGPPSPDGRARVYQEFSPEFFLIPGNWKLAVKVYGDVVKCIPFSVSEY
jgi:hypothetical protein